MVGNHREAAGHGDGGDHQVPLPDGLVAQRHPQPRMFLGRLGIIYVFPVKPFGAVIGVDHLQ